MDAQDIKTLYCPGCGGTLKEVWAEANYGRVLLLDQCHDCGGVWFDRWELYFMKESSLRSLDSVDINTFLSAVPDRKGSGRCPGCDTGLNPFIDPFLPKDASIKRCAGCSGLWLNRGDLSKYASFKKSLKGNAEEPGFNELNTLKHLQKELNTADIAKPAQTAYLDEPPIDTKEVAKDIGFLILQTLLRLVFKF